VVIQFHIKKFMHIGWTNQKVQLKTKKQIMHNSKILTSQTYLSTLLSRYLVWFTHLGRPMYLPTYLSTYLYE